MSQFRVLTTVCFLFVFLIAAATFAQTDLPADERANLRASLDLESLLTPAGELLMQNGNLLGLLPAGLKLNDLQIEFQFAIPVDLSVLRESNGDEFPTSMLLKMLVREAGQLDGIFDSVKSSSEEDELDGRKIYRPQFGPKNVAANMPDDLTLLIGTDNYLTQWNSDIASEALLKLWSKTDGSALRFAADLTDCEDLLRELGASAGFMPPEIVGILSKLSSVKTIFALANPDKDEMIQITLSGREGETKTVHELADAVVELIRNLISERSEYVPDNLEDMVKIMKELGEGLTVSESESNIVITAKRPASLDKRLAALVPEVQRAAEKATEINDMQQVVMALHFYYDSNRHFPFGDVADSDNDLSWRVYLSKYLDSEIDFDTVDFDDDNDSESNAFLIDKMPTFFGHNGKTTGIVGVKLDKPILRMGNITDGTSNTIAFIKTDRELPWAAENDMTIDEIVRYFTDSKEPILVGMFDGSAERLPADIDPNKLRAMLTPDGGEVIR